MLGWRIVEQEQQGKARADYGKHIIQQASDALTAEFGKGFTPTVLRNFRKFYLEFPGLQVKQALPDQFVEALDKIQQPLVAKSARLQKQQPLVAKSSVIEQPLLTQLSWMHYESLMQTPKAKRAPVVKEMKALTADFQKESSEFIKNPLIVEFLGLNQDAALTESTLASTILNHLQKFLMEMGKGYAFVGRQQHIHTDEDDYYIDLIFYNYILKCFVLIDLKTTKISYEDVGQIFDVFAFKKGTGPRNRNAEGNLRTRTFREESR